MRAAVPPALAAGRVRQGAYASTEADGLTGAFAVTCPATGRRLNIIASAGADWAEAGLEGEPWEHVSVSVYLQADKCPSWPEMAWVKSLFWGPEETVMEIHPPESEYVNFHAGCLHLWRPTVTPIPTPPSITVGPIGDRISDAPEPAGPTARAEAKADRHERLGGGRGGRVEGVDR